ncbi:MAG: DNA polymerase III subunit alpha [Rhodospirillales bacterium]|jgi:DNA polymerase-3 subunit alpha|nr:DNA polymerase III subunit alpha [Rhodospirillales bacterium]
MSPPNFVHLRLHSAYSLSEGAIRIQQLVELTRSMGMLAVAMTDTNNLFGAMEFSLACADAGIQPIIGCQISVAVETDVPINGVRQEALPSVVALAMNRNGYGNLMRLLKSVHLDIEQAEEPHVSLSVLEACADDLILLSGGSGGPIGNLLLAGRHEAAETLTRRLAQAFGDRFYVEIQRHGADNEAATEPAFLELAKALGLPLVATNDAFFATQDMYEAHDTLLCISEGKHIKETDRRRLTPEHYLKSAEEMRRLFADLPEAVDNTAVVARRCAFMVERIEPIMPCWDYGEGQSKESGLRAMATDGLKMRLEKHIFTKDMTDKEREKKAKPYRERLEYELGVIIQTGFAGYFLVVAEVVQWAKANDVPVGPGRGMVVGSVVAWALTITDLDPLRFGLLFERFLNPERVSKPYFGIDFCQDKLDQVVLHIQEKHGRDRVARITTFEKFQTRSVMRDVGRVLQMPDRQIYRICKLARKDQGDPMTLPKAIATEPLLQQMIDEDPTVAELVSRAQPLEGLYRHVFTEPTGVVIGDRPLQELIPLYRVPKSDMPATGFDRKWVESAGVVRFDFFGFMALTVLAKACKFIARQGIDIDLSAIPLDDAKTFRMLSHGLTSCVFLGVYGYASPWEYADMCDVFKVLTPDTFEDIIAIVALYRPGPADNIPSYIARKHGREQPDYLYPTLERILKETFGIIIYQEQVMQIAQELAGYSLGGADLLRRAIAMNFKEEMDKQRQTFVDGATARGVAKEKASEIFDQVARFAGYSSNKSHVAAYALVAYQTAYLKANYPREFMAALTAVNMGSNDTPDQA